MAWLTLGENLYPADHPYHWPVIGSMEDLSAASYQDVVDFFKTYYTPANATLAIAGDVSTQQVRQAAEKWFSAVPAGKAVTPIAAPAAVLAEEKHVVLRIAYMPRLYIALHTALARPVCDADITANILAAARIRGSTSALSTISRSRRTCRRSRAQLAELQF
jgi:zinc protease